jgi:hypothetical protein
MRQEWKKMIFAVSLWVLIMVTASLQLIGISFSMLSRTAYLDDVFTEIHIWNEGVSVLKQRIITDLPNGKRSLPYLHVAVTEPWLEQQTLELLDDIKQYIQHPISENIPSIPLVELKNQLAKQLPDDLTDEQNVFAHMCFEPLPDTVTWLDFSNIALLDSAAKHYRTLINMLLGSSAVVVGLAFFICWQKQWDKHECILWWGVIILSIGLVSATATFGMYWVQARLSVIPQIENMVESVGFSSTIVRHLMQKVANDLLEKMVTISSIEVIAGIFVLIISNTERKPVLKRIK